MPYFHIQIPSPILKDKKLRAHSISYSESFSLEEVHREVGKIERQPSNISSRFDDNYFVYRRSVVVQSDSEENAIETAKFYLGLFQTTFDNFMIPVEFSLIKK